MQQIKIFKGLENELPALEKEMNGWLAESGARVLQISGNIAPQSGPTDPKRSSISPSSFSASDVVVVVLYEKL